MSECAIKRYLRPHRMNGERWKCMSMRRVQECKSVRVRVRVRVRICSNHIHPLDVSNWNTHIDFHDAMGCYGAVVADAFSCRFLTPCRQTGVPPPQPHPPTPPTNPCCCDSLARLALAIWKPHEHSHKRAAASASVWGQLTFVLPTAGVVNMLQAATK